MPRTVTYEDLVEAIEKLRTDKNPIVTSKAVKQWFNSKGAEWDAPGWNGRHLDKADDDACERRLLQKWKSGPHKNSMVGWTLLKIGSANAFDATTLWAAGKHWHKV